MNVRELSTCRPNVSILTEQEAQMELKNSADFMDVTDFIHDSNTKTSNQGKGWRHEKSTQSLYRVAIPTSSIHYIKLIIRKHDNNSH